MRVRLFKHILRKLMFESYFIYRIILTLGKSKHLKHITIMFLTGVSCIYRVQSVCQLPANMHTNWPSLLDRVSTKIQPLNLQTNCTSCRKEKCHLVERRSAICNCDITIVFNYLTLWEAVLKSFMSVFVHFNFLIW